MEIISGSLFPASVSIRSAEYGTRAYINSTRSRTQLEAECPADIVQAIYKVWGDKATIEEPVPKTPSAPKPTDTQQQLAAIALHQAETDTTISELQQANAALMLKVAGGN